LQTQNACLVPIKVNVAETKVDDWAKRQASVRCHSLALLLCKKHTGSIWEPLFEGNSSLPISYCTGKKRSQAVSQPGKQLFRSLSTVHLTALLRSMPVIFDQVESQRSADKPVSEPISQQAHIPATDPRQNGKHRIH
jgi:hypothetical protein